MFAFQLCLFQSTDVSQHLIIKLYEGSCKAEVPTHCPLHLVTLHHKAAFSHRWLMRLASITHHRPSECPCLNHCTKLTLFNITDGQHGYIYKNLTEAWCGLGTKFMRLGNYLLLIFIRDAHILSTGHAVTPHQK